MHAKTMEGLIGAHTNMNMTKVPMRVYKEARRKGDLGTMERAMGYVNEFEDKAYQYKDKTEEGMKEESEEAKEKEKLAREQSLEKLRKERQEAEAQRVENGAENGDNITNPVAEDMENSRTDTVEISSEGRELSKQSLSDLATALTDEPVFYSSSGAADTSIHNETPSLNVSV
ncbi:MAG: hypothetical protein NC416_18640 [Eubacterium sp.]|nr:hypothetical protein [Eubacterium sp.]